jgi:hypothetical protein
MTSSLTDNLKASISNANNDKKDLDINEAEDKISLKELKRMIYIPI